MTGPRASDVLQRAAVAAGELEAAGFTVAATVKVSITGPDVAPELELGPRRRRRAVTPALLDDVARLRAEGQTVPEIAAQYGTSVRNASRWVATAAARNGSSS